MPDISLTKAQTAARIMAIGDAAQLETKSKDSLVAAINEVKREHGGSDATVTAENIKSALGYTPADAADVSKLSADKADKLNVEAYGLPVLHLTGDVSAMTKDNAVDLAYVYGERSGTASVKWQGSSSLAYPKKNYTIKFDNAFEAVEGWGEQKKYCLKANFIDHSHARNVVSAKLWGQIVKSREFSADIAYPLDAVTGFIIATGNRPGGMNKVSGGVVTMHNSYASHGVIYLDGPSYPAGTYKISFDVLNPDTWGDGHIGRITAGLCASDGNTTSPIAGHNFDGLNTWVHFDIECTTTYDENYLYLLPVGDDVHREGHKYQFRNITVKNVDDLDSSLAVLTELPNSGAIDGFPCIVELNGAFHGLYTFNIPKDGWMFGMGDGEKEAIVCANNHSYATGFWSEALLDESDFELEYVSDEDNADWVLPSLNTLINACRNSNGTDLDTTIANYLDWASAIDYYILVMLLKGGDMMDKNYLLATYDGTKWFFSAYDMDTTYGLAWTGRSIGSSTGGSLITFASSHKVMDLIRKYKTDALKERYAEIRDTIMSEDNVAIEFLNFVGLIPTVVFDEDVRKWPTIPSTASSNVAQILNWYRMRVAVIDKEMENL